MNWFRKFSLVFAILAGACGELPQPFEHGQQKTVYPLAELAVDVRITPVADLPGPAGRALAQAVAKNLGAYGVTATQRDQAPSRFILEGRAEEAYGPSGNTADIIVIWNLRERDGEETGIHVQELPSAWTHWEPLDAGMILSLGEQPAKAIAALIGVDAELLPSKIGHVRQGIYVAGVAGAPGDGNTTLAAAIRRTLSARGTATTDEKKAAAYILRAHVNIDPPNEGEQHIEIVWRINRPGGEMVGKAAQENMIPARSLDKKWGPIAGYAAAAAVDGIQDILDRDKRNDTRAGIVLPPNSDLTPPKAPKPPPPSSQAGS